MDDAMHRLALEQQDDQWTELWAMKHQVVKAVLAKLSEYIDEAEHQDGPRFWTGYDEPNTPTVDKIRNYVVDFGRYILGEEMRTGN